MCVTKLISIGLDNGLSPGRRQAIIWINAEILLIPPLVTNFSEILTELYTFSFMKIQLKMSSGNGGHFVSASMIQIYRNSLWVASYLNSPTEEEIYQKTSFS